MKKNHRACGRCGHEYSTLRAQCPSCKAWDNGGIRANPLDDGTKLLVDVQAIGSRRLSTGMPAVDELLGGGGIVIGSVVLIGGKAGAGKSTVSLQIADSIATRQNREVMYVAAEEGEHDIKLRFERLNLKSPHLVRVFPMGNHADLVETLRSRAPCATFFDSLPGFVSSPEEGLELCKALKPIAVSLDMPMIVIDHINKQDDFAGLEALQHAVDTLITLFPTGEDELREMEVVKNRNGKAHITLNMMMTETGIFPVLDEETDEDD